jgi:hypothetical protein
MGCKLVEYPTTTIKYRCPVCGEEHRFTFNTGAHERFDFDYFRLVNVCRGITYTIAVGPCTTAFYMATDDLVVE